MYRHSQKSSGLHLGARLYRARNASPVHEQDVHRSQYGCLEARICRLRLIHELFALMERLVENDRRLSKQDR